MRNGNIAAKARQAIQSPFQALFCGLKAALSHKTLHTIQLNNEVFDEWEKKTNSG